MDWVHSISSSWEFISHLPVIVIRDLLLIIFSTGTRKGCHADQHQPVQLWSVSAAETLYLIRIFGSQLILFILYVWKCSAAGCWSLFSSDLFSLLCPRLPGISPTFTISSATKTCNNSNRRRLPNKYFSEGLAKTHNPTDDNKSWAKLRVEMVMIVCVGLRFRNTCNFTCLL